MKHIISAILICLSMNALAVELPSAPDGLSWYKSENGAGTFLKPKDWYSLEEESGNTKAVFLTQQPIIKGEKFSIGLSVNRVVNFSSQIKSTPFNYAKTTINKLIEGKEVLKSGVINGGPTDMNVARIKADNNGIQTIIHYITIGMNDKDEFYLISFEAPEEHWDRHYASAKHMLNYLILGN